MRRVMLRMYIRLFWINIQLAALFIIRTLGEEIILVAWALLMIFNLHNNPHLSYLATQEGWLLFILASILFVKAYGYNWLLRRKDEPMRTPWSWAEWKISLRQWIVWSGVLVLIGILAYTQWHITW